MSWDEVLSAAREIQATAVDAEPELASLPLVGVGWATVEGERAMGELDAVLPGDDAGDSGWVAAPRDEALGARAWLRIPAPDSRPALAVLEPDTEGRLAAALARRGEGVAAIYLGRPGTGGEGRGGDGRGGPLGPGRLAGHGPAWGPHVIVLGQGARNTA